MEIYKTLSANHKQICQDNKKIGKDLEVQILYAHSQSRTSYMKISTCVRANLNFKLIANVNKNQIILYKLLSGEFISLLFFLILKLLLHDQRDFNM